MAGYDPAAVPVPPPGAGWKEIAEFARTFDGYAYWDSRQTCIEIANRVRRRYDGDKMLPVSLPILLTCLFVEERRWRHLDWPPDVWAMAYIRALLEAVRKRSKGAGGAGPFPEGSEGDGVGCGEC